MKILIAIFVFFISHSVVSACVCPINDEYKDKILPTIPVIFEGKVISANRVVSANKDISPISLPIEVKFQVLRVWKGVEKNEIVINAGTPGSCGFEFTEGSTYLVYAYNDPNFATHLCIMQLVDERLVKEFLGEGKTLENLPPPQEGFFTWLWRKITSIFS